MKKKLIAVSCSTLLVVGLLFGSLFVFASEDATQEIVDYIFLPQLEDTSASSVVANGVLLYMRRPSNPYAPSYNYYYASNSSSVVKFSYFRNSSNWNYFVVSCPDPLATVYIAVEKINDGSIQLLSYELNSVHTSTGLYYASTTNGAGDILVDSSLYVFSDYQLALVAQNDGIWSPAPPVDPDYLFDKELGYLQNVHYKQVYNEDSGLTTLDVSFSNITSTGVDLSQSNYGVAISYQAYENAVDDIPFWKSAIYKLVDLALGADIAFQILSHSNVYGQIQDMIGDFTGGGGGHSFSSPENNEPIYLYDLILSPYYFDGTDEYFGYNTMISKVSVDSVGTRMISTGTVSDGGQDDTETYMNSSQVITYYYDYGPESTYLDESTQYYYYITNNDFSTTAVTNNYGDTNTIINNIDNSTDNIYNFQGVGEIPDLDLSAFNIGLQDFIQMIKGVIVSLIIAFPMLSGLFDFLPVFAVSIAIAATQAVAVILIIRIFRGVGI